MNFGQPRGHKRGKIDGLNGKLETGSIRGENGVDIGGSRSSHLRPPKLPGLSQSMYDPTRRTYMDCDNPRIYDGLKSDCVITDMPNNEHSLSWESKAPAQMRPNRGQTEDRESSAKYGL